MATIKELHAALLKLAQDNGGDENTQIGVLQPDGDVFPLDVSGDSDAFEWDPEIEAITLGPDAL